jgi:protein-tyrosine phosphatase
VVDAYVASVLAALGDRPTLLVLLTDADNDMFKEALAGRTLHEYYTLAGISAYRFPVEDGTTPPPDQLEAALAVYKAAVATGGKVLVHCCEGVGRTGHVVEHIVKAVGVAAAAATA